MLHLLIFSFVLVLINFCLRYLILPNTCNAYSVIGLTHKFYCDRILYLFTNAVDYRHYVRLFELQSTIMNVDFMCNVQNFKLIIRWLFRFREIICNLRLKRSKLLELKNKNVKKWHEKIAKQQRLVEDATMKLQHFARINGNTFMEMWKLNLNRAKSMLHEVIYIVIVIFWIITCYF